jgi:signal peptidase I
MNLRRSKSSEGEGGQVVLPSPEESGPEQAKHAPVIVTGPFRPYSVLRAAVMLLWVVVGLAFFRPEFLHGPAGYVIVSGTSMEPTFHSHDFIITQRHDVYERGQVIAYRIPDGETGAGALVIHRIVGGSAAIGYQTKGDNRDFTDVWHPKPKDIIGSAVVKVPVLGDVFSYFKTLMGISTVAAFTALFLLWPDKKDEEETPDPPEAGEGASPPDPVAPASDSTTPGRLHWRPQSHKDSEDSKKVTVG